MLLSKAFRDSNSQDYLVERVSLMWIEMDIEKFKKFFPRLAKEVLEGPPRLGKDPLQGFQPGAVDFIRRARSVEEAMEVIDYLEKRGEITHEEAEKMRKQLLELGLESFGKRKTPGYYFRYAAGEET